MLLVDGAAWSSELSLELLWLSSYLEDSIMLLSEVEALNWSGVGRRDEELRHVQQLAVVLLLQLYDFWFAALWVILVADPQSNQLLHLSIHLQVVHRILLEQVGQLVKEKGLSRALLLVVFVELEQEGLEIRADVLVLLRVRDL